MSVIDNRVVEMQFDNKQFESGVRESIGTIDKLKKALNFSGAEKGLGELSNTINRIDFSPITGAIDAVGSRFSVLEQIGIGVCRRIGEELANTIQKYATDLSVGQITAGWGKYADKTTSVQTILAATGDSMAYVNEQLDKLNWFTDETSYNFVDMVNNIGKFTSNGIKLDTSVTAMQGIANWAAISGQNAQSASRAMYNLAQAIGTGSVKLIDWKSIENANMATQEFKQKVLEAAAAQGTLKKQTDGTYKTLKGTAVTVQNFNSALSEGWFDKNVLMKTLDEYGSVTNKIYELSEVSGATATEILELVDAQKEGSLTSARLQKVFKTSDINAYANAIKDLAKAENDFGIKTFKAAQEAKTFQDAIDATKDAVSTGWMKTFELIFGDYEQAKVLWTDFANNLYDIFAAGGEARNALLAEWSNSEWENFTEKLEAAGISMNQFEDALLASTHIGGFDLQNIVKEYGSITNAAAAGAFGVDTIRKALKQLASDGKGVSKTVSQSTLSYEKLDELGRRIREGTLGGWNSEQQLAALIAEGYTEEQAKVIQKYAEASHELHRSLTEEEAAEYLKEFNKEIEESTELTADQIKELEELAGFDEGTLFDESGTKMLAESINNIFTGIIDTIELVKKEWKSFFGSLTATELRKLTARFRDFTASFALFEEGEGSNGERKLTKRGIQIKHALDLVFEAVQNVAKLFQNMGRIFKQFTSTLDPVKKAIAGLSESFIKLFISVTGKLNNFLGRVDLTSRFQTLSEFIASAINWITEKVDSLTSRFEEYDFSSKVEEIKTKVTNLRNALKGLFGISDESNEETAETVSLFERLATVFAAIKQFFSPVTDFFSDLFSNMKDVFDFSQVSNVADFVKALVEGIMSAISGLWEGIKAGVDNLGITFGDALKMFLGWKVGNKILSAVLQDGKKGFGSLAESISELVDIVKDKGIFGLLGGSDKKGSKLKTIATSLLMIGGALLAVAFALAIVASIKPEKLARAFSYLVAALASTAGILLAFGWALSKLKINSLQLIGAAASLMILGVALIFLAGAIAAFALVAKMDGVWRGLGLMGASLAVVALALGLLAKTCSGVKLMLAATAILVTSAALLVLAGALALFTVVANMDGTVKALITLAVTLGVVVVALIALSAVGPVAIAGAAALLVASVAIIGLAVAIGILALVMPLLESGLTALGNGILGLTTGITESIALVISTIAEGIAEIAEGISQAIVALASGISQALSEFGIGIADLGTGVGTAISEVGTGIGTAIEGVLGGIGTGAEELGAGIGSAISLVGEGISGAISAISEVIPTAGESISEAFGAIGEGIGLAVENAFGGVAEGISLLGEGIGTAISAIGEGISIAGSGISEAFGAIGEGIGLAVENAFGGVAEGLTILGDGISTALEAIGEGVSTAGAGVGAAFSLVGEGVATAIELALGGVGEGLTLLGEGISGALTAIGEGVELAGAGVGSAFTLIGEGIGLAVENALGGVANGIELLGEGISTALSGISESIEGLGSGIATGFENAGTGINNAISTVSESISKFGTDLSATISEVSDSLSEGIEKISTSVSDFAESISNVGSGLTDVGGGIQSIATGLKEFGDLGDLVAMANGLNEIRNSLVQYSRKSSDISAAAGPINDISNALLGLTDVDQKIGNAGAALNGIGNIFKFLNDNSKNGNLKNTANIKASLDALINDIVDAFSSIEIDFTTIAQNAMANFENSIIEGANNSVAAITAMVNAMLSSLSSTVSAFYNIGRYAAIGFNNGMVSMQGTIMANAAKIGSAAASALRNYLGVKSPSRVFAKIGEYTAMGFSKGIEEGTKDVVDSVVVLGEALVNAMQAAMLYAQDQEYGLSPYITPVLDMSNMAAQEEAFTKILNGFNFQGAMADANIDGATINNSIQSRDIINEIRLLNEQMAMLDEDIQNMQIILDTGVLVGSTSAMMDNQFGVMASRRGRGN